MKIEINKKILKIKILEKMNELKKENIIDIFCVIWAFKIEEKNRGNEYDSAWIRIKYIKNLVITENINVFNIVRIPDLYSFVNYIKKIERNFDSQNTETKINLDDYFTQTENISQEIVILMMFEIESEEEKIKETKEKLKNNLKMTGADIEIFDLIK